MENSTVSLKKGAKKKTISKANSKKEAKKKLVSRAEFAKLIGASLGAIHKHIKRGNMTLVDGKIDPVLAKKQLLKNVDFTHGKTKLKIEPDAAGGQTENRLDGNAFNKAKAYKEGYRAKLAELEYKEKIKEYVKAVDVEAAAFSIARKVRDQMLNIPDRVQAEFAALTGIKSEEVRAILLREIKTAIEGL